MIEKYIPAGLISSPHGVRGMVRIQPWCDSPQFLTQFKRLYLGDEKSLIEIIKIKPHSNMVIAAIKNVNSINDAETLRGKTIYFDRDDAPLNEGRYYIHDLIGCEVYDADTNKLLGIFKEVINTTGANDVWSIRENGVDYLVPAIDDVIVSVEPEINKIIIRPLKGIFSDED